MTKYIDGEPLKAKIRRQAAEITRLLAENKELKIEIGRKINALPFWKREKAWNKVKDFVEKKIVQVIDEKMGLIKVGEKE